MDIYLVRVCQRADQSLYLERKPNATTDDDYIAISHVWGTPETITETVVDGHPGVVQLSPQKRDILSILSRPDICDFGWFWMDLFCIDQTETAAISITDQLMSIPHVYKSSRCVKVLLEHPICTGWHTAAMEVLSRNHWDLESLKESFREEELVHSRRCGPHMVCFDPWFERLWTRQEGLYGQVQDIVPLNLIPCPRVQNLLDNTSRLDGWKKDGQALAKRTAAELFLADKLAYHGLHSEQSERREFELYVDFVYRRRVDMANYDGEIGPAATYVPLLAAWRSGRVTTKPRDYVLAVFPDMVGYVPPPDMRKMEFAALLANALNQAPIKQRCLIVPKVLRGMMNDSEATSTSLSLRESIAPWIFEQPSNISDAYDSFTLMLATDPAESPTVEKLHIVCEQVKVEDIRPGLAELPRILKLCTETMDGPKQMALVSLTGPYLGTSRDQVGTERGLVQQYLVHQFAPIAVSQHLEAPQVDLLTMRSAGVVSFDAVKDIHESVFGEELRRYLRAASPCVLSTPFGDILGMLRLEELGASQGTTLQHSELQLLCPQMWHMQGFLVASKTRTGATVTTTVIGRTVIPSHTFWNAIQQSLKAHPEGLMSWMNVLVSLWNAIVAAFLGPFRAL